MNQRARHVAAEWPHLWAGFFEQEFAGHAFDLADYVDPSWGPQDIAALLQYLRAAPIALTTSGSQGPCGLCGEIITPSAYHYDGLWLWPDDLSHLVERHAIVLPDKLVAHIRQRGYSPPPFDPAWIGHLPFPRPVRTTRGSA